jgi:hypothetical protein
VNLGQIKSGRGASKLQTMEHETSEKPSIQIVHNTKKHRDSVLRSLNQSPSVKTLHQAESQQPQRSDKKSRLPTLESKAQLATINNQDEEVNEITSGAKKQKHS